MSKITFINPPWYFEDKRAIRLSQNLGLGYLASYLEKHGHKVTIIDALAEGRNICKKVRIKYQEFLQVGLSYQDILKRIPEDSDYIGISAPFTNNAPIVRELSYVIKSQLRDKLIILGGAYPSLLPGDALSEDIDFCIVGEGEIPLLEMLSGKDPMTISGVVTCEDMPVSSGCADVIENLDTIPCPAREKLPMDAYFGFSSARGKKTYRTVSLITSRGCPYDCAFCSVHYLNGYKWRARTSANVIGEIEQLRKKYMIEHIEFEDDNLILDKRRAIEIFDGIKIMNKTKSGISWSTPNGIRIDNLDEELLVKIKKSNCSSITLAIESGDPLILEKMSKKLDLKKAEYIAESAVKLNMKVKVFFMLGYPGETEESFAKTLSLVNKLKKTGVSVFHFNITRAYPGTRLFDECRKKCYIKYGDNAIFLGNILTEDNAIITPDFSITEIKRRMHIAVRKTVPFYLRFYHRHSEQVKKIIPDRFIQYIKKIMRFEG